MGLRPKRVFNRLNRARLDSSALDSHWPAIRNHYQEIRCSHAQWLKGASPAALASASQKFVDLLSDIFLVSPKSLSLADKPRPHSRDPQGRVDGQLFGSCSFEGNIRIYLRTPSRGQPTAFKTYFNTLIHEWVHHYDFEALGDTVHCAGFYERVGAIYKGCVSDRACGKEEEIS